MSAAPAPATPPPQDGSAAPVEPDFAGFARLYEEGVPQVVWTRLVADLETPVSAMLKVAHERPNSFLLESVEGGRHAGALLDHRLRAGRHLAGGRQHGGNQP